MPTLVGLFDYSHTEYNLFWCIYALVELEIAEV